MAQPLDKGIPDKEGRKGKGRPRKHNIVTDDQGELQEVSLTFQIDQRDQDWNNLPTFTHFVTNPSSKLIKTKDTKSSYIDWKTNDHVIDVYGGRVYRVYL